MGPEEYGRATGRLCSSWESQDYLILVGKQSSVGPGQAKSCTQEVIKWTRAHTRTGGRYTEAEGQVRSPLLLCGRVPHLPI